MDRRREPRSKPSEAISISVVGEGHPHLQGTVVDVSKRGLGIRIPAELPPGTPIKIEFGEDLVLGEVRFCTPEKGAYRVGLSVKHRLNGVAALHRLHRALSVLGSGGRPVSGIPFDETISVIIKK